METTELLLTAGAVLGVLLVAVMAVLPLALEAGLSLPRPTTPDRTRPRSRPTPPLRSPAAGAAGPRRA